MKSLLKISNVNTNEDIIKIREALAENEGLIACEISLSKKEVSLIYDDTSITLDNLVSSIEEAGYTIG